MHATVGSPPSRTDPTRLPFNCLAALVLLFWLASASAQVDPCDAVRDQIAKKIGRNGVVEFDLFVIDHDEPTNLKIVGNCRAGKSKIVYARRRSVATAHNGTEAESSRRGTPEPARDAAPATASPQAAAKQSTPSTQAPVGLWSRGEIRECHFVYPRGWVAGTPADVSARAADSAESDEGARLVKPPPQDGLAALDLQLRFALRRQRPDETSADVLSRRAWDDVAAGLLSPGRSVELESDELMAQQYRGNGPPSREEWSWARSVASKGVFDQFGLEARRDPSIRDHLKRVDQFSVRARQLFEDTSSLELSQANVWHEGQRWHVALALNPEWLSYSMGGSVAERPIYEYRCSIADKFPRDRFKQLCAGFIERSTLGPDFPQRRCERTASGFAFPGGQ